VVGMKSGRREHEMLGTGYGTDPGDVSLRVG
jgi:hypothetical protein